MNTEQLDTKRLTRRTLLAGFGAAALGWMAHQQSLLTPEPVRPTARGTGGIPNPIVTTHEAKRSASTTILSATRWSPSA